MHKLYKNIYYLVILLPLSLAGHVASAQNMYVGVHYHLPFNPIDPFANNSYIQQQYFADGVAGNTALHHYNVSGFGAMLGYEGLFYQEFSVEWRINAYGFSPKEDSDERNVIEQALFIRARTPQIHLNGKIFTSFYVGGGLGMMQNNSGITQDRPAVYDSQNFIAGFEFYQKLNRLSYTKHRFFIELINITAKSEPYQQIAIRGGSAVQRAEILHSRHILFGYSFDIF